MADEAAPQERGSGDRRRRANVQGGRARPHKVAVSEQEAVELKRRAAAAGVTVPRLMVEAALSSTPVETITERRAAITELLKMQRLVSSIARNVNQIAKKANGTGQVPAEAAATIEALRFTARKIDDAVERLAQP